MEDKFGSLYPITWISPKLNLEKIKSYGKGLFAKEKIKKEERLAIFGGHIIPKKFFKKLSEKLQNYPFHIDADFLIGCVYEKELSDGEFFNHSCDPNAGFNGQCFLVAMRDINKGEQVTFDYAMCMTSDIVNMKCLCGSKNCRKKITGNDWKIPELQKKYKKYFQLYIKEKIKKLKNK